MQDNNQQQIPVQMTGGFTFRSVAGKFHLSVLANGKVYMEWNDLSVSGSQKWEGNIVDLYHIVRDLTENTHSVLKGDTN